MQKEYIGIFKIVKQNYKGGIYPASASICLYSNDKKKSWDVPLARIDKETIAVLNSIGSVWVLGKLTISFIGNPPIRLHFFERQNLIKASDKKFKKSKLKHHAGQR